MHGVRAMKELLVCKNLLHVETNFIAGSLLDSPRILSLNVDWKGGAFLLLSFLSLYKLMDRARSVTTALWELGP